MPLLINKMDRTNPLSLSVLAAGGELPPFLKGYSHAVKGEKKRRSEAKKKRNGNWRNLSPMPIKGGPSSMIGVPTVLPIDLDSFYKDLSDDESDEDEDPLESLDKLKTLFRGSNLGQQYSRPNSGKNVLEFDGNKIMKNSHRSGLYFASYQK